MPQGGGDTSQPRQTGQQTGATGQQWQDDAPDHGGGPEQGGAPAESGATAQGEVPAQSGTTPQGEVPAQSATAPQAAIAGRQPGDPKMQGPPAAPVNEIDTRVTGRRIVQYIIDAILYGILAGLISWALDRGTGVLHALLIVIQVVVLIAWYLLYWALRPQTRGGQTVGMQVMKIRVIGSNGRAASFLQLAVRSILLVLFTPLSLLVGIITMMFSRYRQRVGDHMAQTVVVHAKVQPVPARHEQVGAGQAGSR